MRQSLGFKAPRGWGWLTNPRRAAYNRIYRRTTFGLGDLVKTRRRSPQAGCLVMLFIGIGISMVTLHNTSPLSSIRDGARGAVSPRSGAPLKITQRGDRAKLANKSREGSK